MLRSKQMNTFFRPLLREPSAPFFFVLNSYPMRTAVITIWARISSLTPYLLASAMLTSPLDFPIMRAMSSIVTFPATPCPPVASPCGIYPI